MKKLFYLIKFRIVYVAIIAVVPMLFVTLYANVKERSLAISEANGNISAMTVLVSAAIEGYIDRVRATLVTIGHMPEVQQTNAPDCQKELHFLLKSLPYLDGIAVADINGMVWCTTLPPRREKINVLNNKFFRKVTEVGGFIAGDFAVERSTGKPVMYMAYPLRNKEKRLIGVTYAIFNLHTLRELISRVNFPGGYTITLLNSTGVVIAHHPDGNRWVGTTITEGQLQGAIAEHNGVEFTDTNGPDNINRHYGFASLYSMGNAIGLYAGVGRPTEDIFADTRRRLRGNLVGIVLTFVSVIVAGWGGIYVFVTGQVYRLVGVVRRMAGGDLTVRSGFAWRESELGLLAAGIDELGSSLYKKKEDTEDTLSQLRGSRERYSTLVSNIPGAVYRRLADANWTMEFLGSAIKDVCGYPAGAFLFNKERPFAGIVHPGDRENTERALLEAIKAKHPYDLTYRIVDAHNATRWLNDRGAGVYDAQGRIIHLDGVIVDDTMRRQAEEVLLKLNRALRTFGSCSQALVRATDELQLLMRICKTIVTEGGFPVVWVGYAIEEDGVKVVRPVACGGDDKDYLAQIKVRWDDSELGSGPVGSAIKTASPCVVEDIEADDSFAPWRRPARRFGFRSLVCLPLIEGSIAFGALTVYSRERYAFDTEELDLLVKLAGELAYGIVTLRTRVQRWKAEEMIQRISNHHMTVLSAAGEGIVGLDGSGCITFANPAAANMLAWQEDELVGMPIGAITGLTGFMKGAIYSRFDEVFNRKDGSVFAVEYVSTPIEERGQTTGAVLVFRDVTLRRGLEEKQKQHEQLLVQQSKLAAMGEMIGNIAHQWRQPLSVVSGVLLNIQDAYEFGDLNAKYLADKIRQANQSLEFMSVTIDDFRNFFKPDKEKTEFDISEAIHKTVSIVGASLRDNFIDLRMHLEYGLSVNGYSNEFSQVLLNIVTNAKDFLLLRAIRGPVIDIKAYRHSTKAVVVVADNAGGIDEEIIDKVFDPYFTTKEQGKGTGIGLYMSKMIIEGHMGGLLTARNVEHGAEFCILLNAC
ncbi:MAG: cache domain-containing protein [Candidatus Magnetobacterium sp. LHC-1]|uniref:histidine kinase n=1 Tax=Candidatus Magnetobacterium casense TaxID=1455061 RepID=A0ABS6RXN2_9BACT|nr:cache domain-containing protein [Candidatus Magnetobacterium casensis]MBF0609293.1 GAF domain-containing protein [Nitrospirota bacterium]MBV6341384.1 GAF domain-containing protein [Candidatus Magnetobacterium casensis]